MPLEVTERRDEADELVDPDKQFVVTVYDYDATCKDIVAETFDEYGYTVGDDEDFEVVAEGLQNAACFRTVSREMAPGEARSLFDDLVMGLAANLPDKRVVTDEFHRAGGEPRVYSISLV